MSRHFGRGWDGPCHLEALCPCPKAPCGLVDRDDMSDECKQHPPENMKTIRTGHPTDECPGVGRDVVVAMGRTIRAREAVVKAAGEWDGVYFSFDLDDAIDEYRSAVEHEAAERIRTELAERVKKLDGFWAEIRTVSTAQHAADLIDPEVTT